MIILTLIKTKSDIVTELLKGAPRKYVKGSGIFTDAPGGGKQQWWVRDGKVECYTTHHHEALPDADNIRKYIDLLWRRRGEINQNARQYHRDKEVS